MFKGENPFNEFKIRLPYVAADSTHAHNVRSKMCWKFKEF